VAIRQGTMRHSLDEAKNALKSMVALFIDRVGALTLATGDFHQKVGGYVSQIEESDDLAKLSSIVGALLADTRMVHADMERTHDELQRTRQEAQAREARVRQLESELASLGDLVKVDPLTSVLNRRGLDEAFSAEEARAARSGAPLSMALLDVDNFKRLNDQYGHKTGDNALTHLAEILRSTIRPSDKVARFGGEEFVLLLPDTPMEEAVAVMTRVQRELTRRFFLHDNEKILITFSAGVSQWRKGETKEQAFERADAAMYEAKRTGKNRVVCASPS
jgi:diguanylate cyclase